MSHFYRALRLYGAGGFGGGLSTQGGRDGAAAFIHHDHAAFQEAGLPLEGMAELVAAFPEIGNGEEAGCEDGVQAFGGVGGRDRLLDDFQDGARPL